MKEVTVEENQVAHLGIRRIAVIIPICEVKRNKYVKHGKKDVRMSYFGDANNIGEVSEVTKSLLCDTFWRN